MDKGIYYNAAEKSRGFYRSALLGSNIILGSEQLLLGFIRIGRLADMIVPFTQLLLLSFALYHINSEPLYDNTSFILEPVLS